MRTLLRLLPAFAIIATCLGCATRGGLVEDRLSVPVRVVDPQGRAVSHEIVVTLFRDDAAAKPYPLLVLNHGRAPASAERAAMGRAQYTDAARWFAALGFMVAVPTRTGYGVTGGPDVEDTGPCQRKVYEPGYAAAADQTLAVIDRLRSRPDVAKTRTVVAGQSFGGATAITVAGRNPPGVQVAINFAGGGGGNPKLQPQRPCAPHLLERMFAGYGRSARIPTLWIYAENDMFFGPRLPRDWFGAFQAAGGRGEFRQFPPLGEDGHALFTRAPQLWQPAVLAFLRANGFPELPAP